MKHSGGVRVNTTGSAVLVLNNFKKLTGHTHKKLEKLERKKFI
jgi:hypothetical protein